MMTVQEYLSEFGVAVFGERAPHARCPLCHEVLLLIGANSMRIPPRFSHRTRTRARCPLVRYGELPDDIAVTVTAQPTLARLQRAAYFARWQWHYGLMRDAALAPSMNITRFLALAELATQRQLWSIPALNLAYVPYILLAMAGYLPGERGYRRGGSSVRFWFDATVRDVADLHRKHEHAPRLFRAHYARPRMSRFPMQTHLFQLDEVRLDPGYLDRPMPLVSAADVQDCWDWMSGSGT
ncbi:hypothetical protein RN01_07090 [Cupriavidus sp. SHE]|uniref:Uncharacterized protein n=1 Tax=Cupriavidus metallidurans TaxID=119219 RepID=A0A482IP67_9BURK|nr:MULTISPECIES: hypothetical protein [Cupriavidus]KWR84264.1 hypothetical protein RN01_07090 [Cupriavidus sp. SHE]QBP09991.1 hypothetical protein DDF84_009560 [Cupriavidus metallidurans]